MSLFRFKNILLSVVITTFVVNASASDSLSYSGRLVNANGSPVTGPVNLKFDFAYTNATGSILCTQQIAAVALTNGVFHTKLEPDCTPTTLASVLNLVPAGEALAIRVTDETHTKAYSFQALHSMPASIMSSMSKQLVQMGATPGQILTWDGTKWAPSNESGTGDGTVTSVATGTGLTGGPITVTGTISIANGGVDTLQLANSGVTDAKIASGVTRSKLANGTANYVVVNNGAGVISEVASISLAQGGTGANTAAGARTNLGLGTAAVADVGFGAGSVMAGDSVPICLANQKLQMNAGPVYWSCALDNDSLDNTKLPLDGSAAMTGALDMDSHKIIDVTSPTDPGDAANKAYVDAQIGALTSSQWLENAGEIYYNGGNVGVGTNNPASLFNAASGNADIRLTTGAGGNTPTLSVINTDATGKASGLYSGTSYSGFLFSTDNSGFFSIGGAAKSKFTSNAVADGTESYFMTVLGNGNVGIGTQGPNEKLDVAGNIAATGKLRLKSDTANYVELQAPASLAGTLNFKLPGTAGAAGNALVTDGSGNLSWAAVATGASAVGGDLTGTITNAQIVAGTIVDADVSATAAIAQSKISGLTTDLAGKEPTITAGTNLQYWRGDKTWQTLNTTAVPEGTNLYFTEPRVLGTDLAGYAAGAGAITAADTVLTAIEKLDGNINALSAAATTDFVNITGDTMTGALILNADPAVALGAATKQYVDAQVSGTSYWTKTGSVVHYNGGSVGVGTSAPSEKLAVYGDGAYIARETVTGIDGVIDGVFKYGFYNDLKAGGSGFTNRWHGLDATITAGGGANNKMMFKMFQGGNNNVAGAYVMTLQGDGNVGIGTTAAEEKLDIATSGFMQVSSEASNGNSKHLSGIKFKEITGADHGAKIYYDGHGDVLKVSTIEAGVENSALNIPRATGYVGVGGVSPSEKLHVNGNARVDGNLLLKSDNANVVVLRAPGSLAASLNMVWPGTAGASGNALTTDGAGTLSWSAVATTASAVGGDLTGTIANAQIAAGAIVDADVAAGAAIAQSKIANLTTDLAAKEPTITAGTNLQYWRGDKTWQTLNTTAVPEGTNLYFLDSRVRAALMSGYAVGTAVPLAATDTLIEAIGKLEAQIIANDTAFDSTGQWSKSGANVNYTAGKVSVGSTTTTQAVMNIGGGISGTTRAWLDRGITFGIDGESDGGYIGIKNEGANRLDTVLAFGDDVGDNLRFIYNGSGGPVDGVDMMKLTGAGKFHVGLAQLSTTALSGNSIIDATGNSLVLRPPVDNTGDVRISDGDSAGYLAFANAAISTINSYSSAGVASTLGLNTNGAFVGVGTAAPEGKLHLSNIGWSDQTVTPDTASFPVANNGGGGLVLDGTYTNGQYRTRFISIDRGSNLPLYIQQSRAGANSFQNVARFGYHQSSAHEFEVWGSALINGNVNATAFLYTSDKRLKKDFKELQDPIGTIMKLHGLSFTWKDSEKRDVGFIAQEVEKVVPEIVNTDKVNGKKSVQYGNIVAILVEAFKDHFDQTAKENAKLKREIASLKEENARMDARLDRIEKSMADKKAK